MTQPTTPRTLSAAARALILALAVLMLMGVALAAPTRLRAQTAAPNATEMLIFDWNKPVTKTMGGFAQYKPLSATKYPNGNWLSPINWTNGTLYFRARVLSIPQNQPSMKLGFCFWQNSPRFGEECTKNYSVPGAAGTERRWNQSFKSMAKINGAAINWALPRWKAGFVVRGPNGPVSPKAGMNWGGQNPAHWYPLNIHYTAVLVINGSAPDWTKYGWSSN